LVELARLADPLMVPQTVIAALGLIAQSGKTPSTFLADYLRQKRALLILDNCEHLVAACADLATALLHSAPRQPGFRRQP
jgi:predicted ATPase